MIEPCNFVRGRNGKSQRWCGPRRASAERGPVRGQRNFWDVADDNSEAKRLAFAYQLRKCSSVMFETPFRSGIWGGDGRLTLFVQGPYSWSGGVMATPTFCRSEGIEQRLRRPQVCLFMTT